jgi:hypothetical protein
MDSGSKEAGNEIVNNKVFGGGWRVALPAALILIAGTVLGGAVVSPSQATSPPPSAGVAERENAQLDRLAAGNLDGTDAADQPDESVSVAAETTDGQTLVKMGINYSSAWHLYSSAYTTDEILNRDFARFNQDGIEYICLYLYWYRLEGNTRGDYTSSKTFGDAYLKDVARVIGAAHSHGIKVMVTISTLWGADGEWCTPDYVIDPVTGKNHALAVIRSKEMNQAFLDVFTHTVEYLMGTAGIWSWALNEPWYYPRVLPAPFADIDQRENFITLFQDMQQIVRTRDGRPFTIQFPSAKDLGESVFDIFSRDWQWDQRIFDAVDFVSLSSYPPAAPRLWDDWKATVGSNVAGCVASGKRVWVAQIGATGDDQSQVEQYGRTVGFLRTLPVDGIMPWQWRGDGFNVDWSPPGSGTNLCADPVTGVGRPAYDLLVRLLD